MIKLLLKRGASAKVRDEVGNTPAHAAAAAGQLASLAAVLQCDRPPSVGLRNDAGVSIGEAAAAAMANEELREFAAERPRPAAERWGGSGEEEEGWEEEEVEQGRDGTGGGKHSGGWFRPAKRRRRSVSPAIPTAWHRPHRQRHQKEEGWRERLAEEFSDEEGGGWG